jgi:hypothetical protein
MYGLRRGRRGNGALGGGSAGGGELHLGQLVDLGGELGKRGLDRRRLETAGSSTASL